MQLNVFENQQNYLQSLIFELVPITGCRNDPKLKSQMEKYESIKQEDQSLQHLKLI